MRLQSNSDDMSHHSDDGMLVPGSDSFWEPGNYKRTTRRIEDGEKLCRDLILLVQERSNIEKEYAKQMKTWSTKWNSIIEKGPEYGTTEAAWKAVLVEADRRCELHLRVKDNLVNDVVNSIKNWQKDNYHKQLLQLKEKKEMEDQFKKAQKPWAKLLEKVDKTKTNYHLACKNEKTAVNQERNATKDSSLSQDQVRKLQEKVSKAQEGVKKCKENYELALLDISNYNSRYQEDMTDVFERCQRKEAQRLQTFKDTLFSIHKSLNVCEDPALPQIYDEFYHTVNNADHEKDLRWWSNTHGVNMPMAWPQFEEYNVKPAVKKTDMNGAPKTGTTSINHNSDFNSSQVDSNGVKDANPFDDESEEWDDGGAYALVDNGEPGVAVKALYDYEAAEQDELTFKSGEEFEKLEDEDEQGWCKGRKDGRVGLYPANYVEPV
eukprot:GFUD01032274.1.p1 GENE.GFUD01032274.1~~GFUD01032274.1.p1  ORF type:complete len:434 (+),score=121.81 GFUD01032274.1:728-2029(+)